MIVAAPDFAAWRAAARALLAAGVAPAEVTFETDPARGLFAADEVPPAPAGARLEVPRAFVALAEAVACHRDPRRWDRLYRALWRLSRGEPHLLDLATDGDVSWLLRAEQSVRRDVHKMHAFVRFRRVGEHFVAWHRPDHRIVRRAAPFFARRFPEMLWSVLTPDESVSWDGGGLHFGPGVPASQAPAPDVLEELWRAYYRATFNPARIKLAAMRKEMPVRHWATLPEAALIPDLLAEAPARVAAMVTHREGERSAAGLVPAARDLGSLRAAAAGCSACGRCGPAAPPVFGSGPPGARVALVSGGPLGGAAGELLDAALGAAGISRDAVYRTAAVKGSGTADAGAARACRPWLEAELAAIGPAVVVCLGPLAAGAVLGPLFRFTARRGELLNVGEAARAVATHCPSAVLRNAAGGGAEMRADLIRHLTEARRVAEEGVSGS